MASAEEKAAMLEAIAEEIRQCRRCPLARTRKNAVPGEGPADAPIMFIGEAPGRDEDEQGRPFVGAAGKYLNGLLRRAGVEREQVFITNIVKCRPPGNREPNPDEVEACREFLDGQIAAIQPKVICLLGRPATVALLGRSVSMKDVHGKQIERNGIIYIPLYHPAAALHNYKVAPLLTADFESLAPLFREVLGR